MPGQFKFLLEHFAIKRTEFHRKKIQKNENRERIFHFVKKQGALVLALATLPLLSLSACQDHSDRQDTAGGYTSRFDTPEAHARLQKLSPSFAGVDLSKGEAVAEQCLACHTLAKGGANMTGPNLYGLLGRKAGAIKEYSYSEALKTSQIIWTVDNLDIWLKEPRDMVSGTKMSYPGLQAPHTRRDLIAYLALVTSDQP